MAATSPTQRRYPGVRHFEERDQAQFRGRTAAAEELLLRVLSVRLLLQFAPSGVGKTSLLTAGLFPLLRPHHYFPFIVRLNQPHESLVEAVRRSLTAALADFKLNEPVVPTQAQDLWSLLAGTQLWTADLLLLTPVLVFDQFEEIFTLRDAGFRDDFAHQLGELAAGTPRRAAQGMAESRPDIAPPAKFVISLREEYLGKLEEFSSRIPELFRERLRVAPLSADEARQAIVEPAALPGDAWASPPFGYSDDTLAQLIDFIDGSSAVVRVIEPLTLQLVCRRAEDMAIERGAAAAGITLNMQDFGGLAGLDRLVREHYQKVLGQIESTRVRRRAQRLFEEGLLDPAGKRLMLEQGEIKRIYDIDVSTLDALVDSSVLRREPRNESVFYEISHDRLTETIARHRRVYLPGWVVPTLVGAVCVLAVVGGLLWHQVYLREQANAAHDAAEYSLGQLLGESLVSRLREAGLSDALGQLLERSASGTSRDEHAPGLASVLRLRHEGDIARDSATLAKARERYRGALGALDALPGSNERRAMLSAERARIGSALGIVAFDAGQLQLAETHLDASLHDWQAALEAASPPRPLDLLDAADSHLARGRLFSRTGDYHRAEEEALAASRIALRVLKQAYGGRDASALDATYDTGRAMQVFADAALNLHVTRPDLELADAAVLLAREAARLRPQSFQAHKQLGTAIATRYGFAPPASRSEWNILLVEGRGLFDKLWADGGNLTMRRERAAIETLIGEIIAECIANATGCRGLLPEGESDRSRIGVLESTGIFRWLASKDLDNGLWKSDVAWALRVQSKQQANTGDPAAITTLQRAIEWTARTPMAPRDVDARLQSATDLMQLAKLHAKADRRTDARLAIEGALAQFDDAAGQSVGAQSARIILFDQAVPLLKQLRMDRDAALLQARLDALPRLAIGPSSQSYAKAVELNDQAIDLTTKVEGKADAQSDSAWLRVEQLHAEAVDEYPFDEVLWINLRLASRRVAELSHADSPEHEMAMRRALIAAWMAKVLQPDNPQYLRSLYVARLELAVALINNGGSDIEVQALVDRALMDAKEMARDRPASNDSRFHLADANLGVGYVREAQRTDGWDEAFRVALLHGEELAKRAPGTAGPHFWLAEQRHELAQRLERDQRAGEAAEQRRLALQACRRALALPAISGDERKQAQDCLTALADAGVK